MVAAALGRHGGARLPPLANVLFGGRTLPEQALTNFPTDLLSFVVLGPLVAVAPAGSTWASPRGQLRAYIAFCCSWCSAVLA